METRVSFDRSRANKFLAEKEFANIKAMAETAKKTLLDRSGAGNDFLGWIDLPVNYDKEEVERIKKSAAKIKSDSDVLIVIGIGGSYLGARAAVEFLNHIFYNNLPKEERRGPEIYFAGSNISSTYMAHLLKIIGDRDFSINVISKSGTTTEPAIAFRVFKDALEKRYGKEEAAKRIYATTDKARGALKYLATEEGYESFIVPDDIGGRYSVLTAVGLLPIAAAGADLDKLMAGAQNMREHCINAPFEENHAMQYAATRNILLKRGKMIEILGNYEPHLHSISEWWKQLFGESEGKDGKGLFPASVDLSTDLHSMGQFIQDGSRIMFETLINVHKTYDPMTIGLWDGDLDGLNYLNGQTVDYVNNNAMMGTMMAHIDGGVPNVMIHVPECDEYCLGELFYFFEFACGISGYLLCVNPFDQPGVEAYKRNMFALLGKPGYEEAGKELREQLGM